MLRMAATIDTTDSVTKWAREWLALWRATARDPFLHPTWHRVFVETGPAGLRPELIGVRADGQLVGLLPMRRDPDKVLRFLTSPRSDYEDALLLPSHRDAALACLADHLARERFLLAEMPEESPLADVLRARGIIELPGSPCPGIRLTPETTHDVTHRKSVVRHERKLARRGPLVLERVEPEDADAALEAMFDQHIARRLAAGDESLFLNEDSREFYKGLVACSDFADFGCFDALKAGDRDVAYHFGLYGAATFIWYKPTFDMNLQQEGPGEVLFKLLVEHASATGHSYFDFSRGDEPFKLRFANVQRRNRRLRHRLPISQAVARRIRAKVDQFAGLVARARARLIPASPAQPEPTAIQVAPPESLVLPTELSFDLGSLDLIGFAKLRSVRPEYVTSERMRQAIERARGGDRLLIVRDVGRGVPVHFAWLRTEGGAPAPAGDARDQRAATGRRNVVYEQWTAHEAQGRNVGLWAVRYLAWHGGKEGVSVWVQARDSYPGTAVESAAVVP
jgi:CelD/BcsL family acetyltransferase involved in cellulose biosynthesis